VREDQLPMAFQRVYPIGSSEFTINQEELILVDVKIKAEVQRIEEAPEKLVSSLENLKAQQFVDNVSQLEGVFAKYKKEYFNIFFVYFGDVNFGMFRQGKYAVKTIKIFGHPYKVRIFAFFISKQALI
jgi:hypothetical protein